MKNISLDSDVSASSESGRGNCLTVTVCISNSISNAFLRIETKI